MDKKVEKQNNSLENMLTVDDVMEHLNIKSKTTAYKLFELDSFPSIKIGRKYLIHESKYKKWLESVVNTQVYL